MSARVDPDDLTARARPAQRDGTTAVEVDGELVVFDATTGALHRLDRIAALVWPFLDGEATVAELAADLADAFGTDEATVTEDLLALVRQLGRVGLLEGVRPDRSYRPAVPTGPAESRSAAAFAEPPYT